MDRTISFEYAPELVRKAAKRFLFRYQRKMLWLAAVVLLLGVALLLLDYGGWLAYLALLAPVVVLLAWKNYIDAAVKTSKELPNENVSVTITDESITFATSQHTSKMNWTLVKEVWRFPDVWLFFTYSAMSYVLIPTKALDEELCSFTASRISEAGGKVV
jgi:hypothetical protein